MEMDELKLAWQELDRKLDQAVKINRRLEIAGKLRRVGTPLRRLAMSLVFEAGIGVCAMFLLGRFIFENLALPRFVWPAAILDMWVIASMAGTISQLFRIPHIDYDLPIVEIQTRIEALRLLRLRVLRWLLITGQAVWWLPFLIVLFRGLLGVDVYHAFGLPFLLINGGLSVLVLVLSAWWSRRLVRHAESSPLLRKFAGHIAGRHIESALVSLQAITAFESEEAA